MGEEPSIFHYKFCVLAYEFADIGGAILQGPHYLNLLIQLS